LLLFTIIKGLVFLISEPTAGSRLTSHTSSCFIKWFSVKLSEYNQFFVCFVVIVQDINGLVKGAYALLSNGAKCLFNNLKAFLP